MEEERRSLEEPQKQSIVDGLKLEELKEARKKKSRWRLRPGLLGTGQDARKKKSRWRGVSDLGRMRGRRREDAGPGQLLPFLIYGSRIRRTRKKMFALIPNIRVYYGLLVRFGLQI